MCIRDRKADEAEGELSSDVQENITGVRVVRAFGRERDELEKFRKKNNNYANIWMKLGDMMTVFWSLGDVMSMAPVSYTHLCRSFCVRAESPRRWWNACWGTSAWMNT